MPLSDVNGAKQIPVSVYVVKKGVGFLGSQEERIYSGFDLTAEKTEDTSGAVQILPPAFSRQDFRRSALEAVFDYS